MTCLFLRGKKEFMRTEEEIIQNAFALAELDIDYWESESDEYALARVLLQNGVSRWEGYENTLWRELLTKLSSAADGDKSVTTAFIYDCPTNFMYPGGWVRTVNGTVNRYWTVIKPENVSSKANSQEDYCYFLGDEANGFTLNFNPNVTMPTGDTIEYEYYRKAATTAAVSDKVEMSDPYFLSYFIAAHLGEDGIDQDKFTIAEARLNQMQTKNMSGVFGVSDQIDNPNDFSFGE